MLDCGQLTYAQMADIVRSIAIEIKNRNSIGVNMYMSGIWNAVDLIEEISGGEQYNFTSESGPVEPKENE